MNPYEESQIALAARHVAEGRAIVSCQRERIVRLKALGCSTLDHQQTLAVFERTLEILIDHEQTLRDQDIRKKAGTVKSLPARALVYAYG